MKTGNLIDLLVDIAGEGDYVAFKRLGLRVPDSVPLEAFNFLHEFEISILQLVNCMNRQVFIELNRR